jgi:hypothetical protein
MQGIVDFPNNSLATCGFDAVVDLHHVDGFQVGNAQTHGHTILQEFCFADFKAGDGLIGIIIV